MRVLFFGDVVGRPGRDVVLGRLGDLKKKHKADVVILNGENAAAGTGITPPICREFYDAGVDVITLGNHAWDKREITTYIDEESRLIRPLNFPPGTPGAGSYVLRKGGQPVLAVMQVHGRVFSPTLFDDPFRLAEAEAERLAKITPNIVVDVHGEATSEKMALAWFLDGRVSAVIGTHTHVQTADERVLPGGTAYLTDVGMCGPYNSIIGTDPALVLERFLTQMPVRLEVARGPAILCAAVVDIDPETGRAHGIARIQERMAENKELDGFPGN